MFALLSSVALADDFIGQASVVDGDTLEIHGTRIRLWGIDAPESSQLCRGEDSLQYRCGAQAANDLDAFIARRPVNCVPLSLDQYGRTVATCSVGGADLGDGLCRAALRWIGPNTQKVDMPGLSRRPSVVPAESGRAAMSSRGSIAPVSARTESPPAALTTQTPIRDRYTQSAK